MVETTPYHWYIYLYSQIVFTHTNGIDKRFQIIIIYCVLFSKSGLYLCKPCCQIALIPLGTNCVLSILSFDIDVEYSSVSVITISEHSAYSLYFQQNTNSAISAINKDQLCSWYFLKHWIHEVFYATRTVHLTNWPLGVLNEIPNK